jgi:hypothetical protein
MPKQELTPESNRSWRFHSSTTMLLLFTVTVITVAVTGKSQAQVPAGS